MAEGSTSSHPLLLETWITVQYSSMLHPDISFTAQQCGLPQRQSTPGITFQTGIAITFQSGPFYNPRGHWPLCCLGGMPLCGGG
ncbi:hypothetical protein JTE90_025912 [Oedothorax gibbosus]|uniref:Uncharacterized protein n=1 Tax=Oedothorax gibbosus TaxID=931172 RepID=A0AAV6UUQ8_9ARAC|nr:hypothetical protein JTE90_025912 [Oedothorax gibbosus]